MESMGFISRIFVNLDDFTLFSVASVPEDNIFMGDVWRKSDRKAGVFFVTICFFASFCNNNVFFPIERILTFDKDLEIFDG